MVKNKKAPAPSTTAPALAIADPGKEYHWSPNGFCNNPDTVLEYKSKFDYVLISAACTPAGKWVAGCLWRYVTDHYDRHLLQNNQRFATCAEAVQAELTLLLSDPKAEKLAPNTRRMLEQLRTPALALEPVPTEQAPEVPLLDANDHPLTAGDLVKIVPDVSKSLSGRLATLVGNYDAAAHSVEITLLDEPKETKRILPYYLEWVETPGAVLPEQDVAVTNAQALASVLVATQAPADDVARIEQGHEVGWAHTEGSQVNHRYDAQGKTACGYKQRKPGKLYFVEKPEKFPKWQTCEKCDVLFPRVATAPAASATAAGATEQPADIKLSTEAWDLLEQIAQHAEYNVSDSENKGRELNELQAAGLVELMPFKNGTTVRATAAGIEADQQPVELPALPSIVKEIPLADIDTSRNYRQVFDEADLAELAESITAHGVMQPVLVRPTPAGQASQPYQLVYGGRRYKASALAGMTTIPATIRELSDLAFAEMQLVENVQRKDVRPSDEARAFHDLLTKHNKTPEELSHQVGRPVKFVLQRAKLITLIPFWMEALEQERLSLVSAHELARLPEAGQLLLVEAAGRNYDLNRPEAVFTPKWISTGISQWVLADLNAAFFRKQDETLFPKAGPCTTCPKRSGACRGLFDEEELKHDYCLDKSCFEQKKANLVERHKVELRNQTGKKAVLISCNYYQVPAGVLDCYRYKEAKQEDPGAVQAVMIDGAEMGRIKWVTIKASTSTDSSKDKEADAARLRKERLTKTHRALIAEKLTADLPAAVATQGPVYESVLTWLLLDECGTSKSTLAYLGDSWGWEPTEADIRNDYNDKDARGFRPWHRFVLRMIGPMSLKQRMELYMSLKVRHRMDYDYEDRQFTIAKLVNGLGYPELEAEAEQAIVARYYTKKGAKQ